METFRKEVCMRGYHTWCVYLQTAIGFTHWRGAGVTARKWTMFHVFNLLHWHMNIWSIYEVCMSPALSWSSAIQRFIQGNTTCSKYATERCFISTPYCHIWDWDKNFYDEAIPYTQVVTSTARRHWTLLCAFWPSPWQQVFLPSLRV